MNVSLVTIRLKRKMEITRSFFYWTGNELCGNAIGASVTADRYASDVIALKNIVQDVYRGVEPKPLIIAPGGFFDVNWFTEFLNKSRESANVITHHIYNLGPGKFRQNMISFRVFSNSMSLILKESYFHTGVDDHLVEKILDPTFLDGVTNTFRDLKNVLRSSRNSAKAWVGEAGGSYNSGRHLVSDAFVNSFWLV